VEIFKLITTIKHNIKTELIGKKITTELIIVNLLKLIIKK